MILWSAPTTQISTIGRWDASSARSSMRSGRFRTRLVWSPVIEMTSVPRPAAGRLLEIRAQAINRAFGSAASAAPLPRRDCPYSTRKSAFPVTVSTPRKPATGPGPSIWSISCWPKTDSTRTKRKAATCVAAKQASIAAEAGQASVRRSDVAKIEEDRLAGRIVDAVIVGDDEGVAGGVYGETFHCPRHSRWSRPRSGSVTTSSRPANHRRLGRPERRAR